MHILLLVVVLLIIAAVAAYFLLPVQMASLALATERRRSSTKPYAR